MKELAVCEISRERNQLIQNKQNNTRVSKKFYNILVHTSLWCVYHVIEAVQGMVGTHCG